jgi:hypothetical protein
VLFTALCSPRDIDECWAGKEQCITQTLFALLSPEGNILYIAFWPNKQQKTAEGLFSGNFSNQSHFT